MYRFYREVVWNLCFMIVSMVGGHLLVVFVGRVGRHRSIVFVGKVDGQICFMIVSMVLRYLRMMFIERVGGKHRWEVESALIFRICWKGCGHLCFVIVVLLKITYVPCSLGRWCATCFLLSLGWWLGTLGIILSRCI